MMAGNSSACPVFMHAAARCPGSALSISIQTLHHSPVSRVVARQLEQAFCARSLHANVIADGFYEEWTASQSMWINFPNLSDFYKSTFVGKRKRLGSEGYFVTSLFSKSTLNSRQQT